MLDTVVNQIIKQEIQLLDKIEPLDVLAELIDNEFIEIGSSAVIYDKTEIIRWLASNDPSERIGTSFKAHPLAENIILLTYMSSIKDTPLLPKVSVRTRKQNHLCLNYFANEPTLFCKRIWVKQQ